MADSKRTTMLFALGGAALVSAAFYWYFTKTANPFDYLPEAEFVESDVTVRLQAAGLLIADRDKQSNQLEKHYFLNLL
jgi:hypothetical protein